MSIEAPLRGWLAGATRVAVVGVGQELAGDDAAGMVAARRLALSVGRGRQRPGSPEVRVFLAGPVPENFAGQVERFRPSHCLVLDAGELGQPPGAIAWLEADECEGPSLSSHRLPVAWFLRYLSLACGCRTAVIAIQPRQLSVYDGLSPEVAEAALALARLVRAALRQPAGHGVGQGDAGQVAPRAPPSCSRTWGCSGTS